MGRKTSAPAQRGAARAALPDGRAAEARAGRSSTREALIGVQSAAGNTAVGRLLAGGAPSIGRPDDGAELRADRHVARMRSGRAATPARRIGLAGAPRLGGGRPLPPSAQRRLAPHFAFDLEAVHMHTGPEVDAAAHAMGAAAFTRGRDVFVRRDRSRLDHPQNLDLMSHELAHVQAEGGRGRTIRRKMGLPSAAQATKTAGGSGLGIAFKGAWGAYRGLLDRFRATPDGDTGAQARLLEQLTTASQRVLDGGYDAAKGAFVREQRPKIKRLYYEVAHKADVFDAVRDEATTHEATHRQHIQGEIDAAMAGWQRQRQKAAFLAMKPADRPANFFAMPKTPPPTPAPSVDALLDRLDRAAITMNFKPSTLSHFIRDSDVKQFWELRSDESSSGAPQTGPAYGAGRKAAEQIMGYSTWSADPEALIDDPQRAHRPISCGLNVFDDPKGAAPGYGAWHFKLDDRVKSRATYFARDSVNDVKRRMAGDHEPRHALAGVSGKLAGALGGNRAMLLALVVEATGAADLGHYQDEDGIRLHGTAAKLASMLGGRHYMEVQVHGGISIDDIDYLAVDVPGEVARRTAPGQQADGALVDRWRQTYGAKARVRWSDGTIASSAPAQQADGPEAAEGGAYADSKASRDAAVKLLEDLAERRWWPALEKFHAQDIAYEKAEFLAGAKWVKWFRGTAGVLDEARLAAKGLRNARAGLEPDAVPEHLGEIARIAGVAAGADLSHFWATNHPFTAAMVRKIAHYLINALPTPTLHQTIEDHVVEDGATEAHPVAVLMMGGSGSGKGRVKALDGIKPPRTVDIDADAVKSYLPTYRAGVQARDSKAASAAHAESQAIVSGVLAKAIDKRQNLLYDATGANRATYLGGAGGVGGQKGLLKWLKASGYETRAVMVYTPVDKAVERARLRAEQTGREVPEATVRGLHAQALYAFSEYAGSKFIDRAAVYDNSGDAPRCVWTKDDSGPLRSSDRKTLNALLK